MACAVRLLTWNVAGRLTRLEEQADRVVHRDPDVVCLQEVIPKALPAWLSRLDGAGYAVAASHVAPDAERVRRLGVLIASRLPLSLSAEPPPVPWPERLLAADVQPLGWPQPLRVVCLHAPLSQKAEQVKVRTFEALYERLTAWRGPAVVCGDLNTPQYEARDGTVQTFAQTRTGRLRPGRGERHDRAERMMLAGPPGWQDAFRALHGYEARDRSWKMGRHPGYRLDHILVSADVRPVECAYDHSLREDALSDHSGLFATVVLRERDQRSRRDGRAAAGSVSPSSGASSADERT